ncbi:hypothetical protein GGI35DRAFT_64562 [Trichoderma velutinum]
MISSILFTVWVPQGIFNRFGMQTLLRFKPLFGRTIKIKRLRIIINSGKILRKGFVLRFPSDIQMTDEKNISEFTFIDLPSSTSGWPTPSTTMSDEEIPIRDKNEDTCTFSLEDFLIPKKKRSTSQEDTAKAGKSDSPATKPAKVEEGDPPRDNPGKDKHEEKNDSSQDDFVKPKQFANPPENHPIPDRSFMIVTRNKPQRIFALKYGQPEFLAKPIPSGGHIWRCIEKDGHLTFRNMASGTYLGHNDEGKVGATQKQPKQHEYFTAMRKENGGYVLSVPKEGKQIKVAVSEDGKSLILRKGEGEGEALCHDPTLMVATMGLQGRRNRINFNPSTNQRRIETQLLDPTKDR